MSQKRVITGSDDRGRPISRWEDAEPSGYGFMEPAFTGTIERRQATPDELAAARARETPTETLKRPNPVSTEAAAIRMQATRMHVEVAAAAKAETRPRLQWWTADTVKETEEGPMADDLTPDSDASEPEAPSGPLWALSLAARDADVAWLSLQLAELTWDVSRAALAAAMRECAAIMEPAPGSDPSPAAGVTEPDVEPKPLRQSLPSFEEVMSEPAPLAETAADHALAIHEPKPLRQPGHHDAHAGQSRERDERAQRVTEAVARHGGDRSAAAAELGMRPNAVAMVLKHADRRAEASA